VGFWLEAEISAVLEEIPTDFPESRAKTGFERFTLTCGAIYCLGAQEVFEQPARARYLILLGRITPAGGHAVQAQRQGMEEVIPPRKNRKTPRSYDKYLYRYRHLVENAFLQLKRWRGIATRYAKRAESFLMAVQIRCLTLWLGIL
jgi:hypothetical protein